MRKFRIGGVFSSVPAQLFAVQIIVAISALVVNVLSARALGPSTRGELALFLQIAYVANAMCLLGRSRSYLMVRQSDVRSLPGAQRDIASLSRLPLLCAVLIAVAISAIVGDGVLAALVLAVGLFTLIASGIQQKTHRAAAIVVANGKPYLIATVVGQALLLVSAVLLVMESTSNLSVWLLAYGLTALFPYLVVDIWGHIKSSPNNLEQKSALKEVAVLGLKLVPTSVASILGSRADRFLIPALSTFGQLGIYAVVVTITELVSWPVKSYTDSRVPAWRVQIAKNSFRLLKEFTFVVVLITALGGMLGVGLYAVLVPLFGEEYRSGLTLIWPLVLAAGLHALNHFGSNVSLAAGYVRYVNFIPITGMIASVAFCVALIPKFGSLGAAWALVIGYAVAMVPAVMSFRLLVSRRSMGA